MTLTDQIAAMENELIHLRLKSDNDDKTLDLLKIQNRAQATELLEVRKDYDRELSALRQERDVAIRRAAEVRGLLEGCASFVTQGVRKMIGDEMPEEVNEINDPRLPLPLFLAAKS